MRFFLINVDFFLKKLRFLSVFVVKVVVFLEVFVPISVLEEFWSLETSLDHVWKKNLWFQSCWYKFTRKLESILLVYAKPKAKTPILRKSLSFYADVQFTQKLYAEVVLTQKILRITCTQYFPDLDKFVEYFDLGYLTHLDKCERFGLTFCVNILRISLSYA